MNYIEKLDKAIALIREALEEAEKERNRLSGDKISSPLKRVFNQIKNCGLIEGKRYKASEILSIINITNAELESFSNFIPMFGGTREIRFGKLLSFLTKYNMDGYVLKEGVINGCKSYRIEQV